MKIEHFQLHHLRNLAQQSTDFAKLIAALTSDDDSVLNDKGAVELLDNLYDSIATSQFSEHYIAELEQWVMLDNQIDVADIHHASVISEVSKQTLSTLYKDEPVIVYRHYNSDDQVYNIRAVVIDNISPNSK